MNEKKVNWFLLGDIHGQAKPIRDFYIQNRDRLDLNNSTNFMILLGDVGLNFTLKKTDSYLKETLSNFPFHFICLRGNHEARATTAKSKNPEGWDVYENYGGTVFIEREYPNIEYLSDAPAVYNFDGIKTLAIPGAYSIDKQIRLQRDWPWYPDEQLSKAEMEQGRKLIKQEKCFNLVISHTAPMCYVPTDLFLKGYDQSLVDRSMEEYLGEIEFDLDYKRWCFGHYHADRLYPYNNGKQVLMLFNENVVDLKKFMNMQENDCFQDILAGENNKIAFD